MLTATGSLGNFFYFSTILALTIEASKPTASALARRQHSLAKAQSTTKDANARLGLFNRHLLILFCLRPEVFMLAVCSLAFAESAARQSNKACCRQKSHQLVPFTLF
jgi:hypothetical protein